MQEAYKIFLEKSGTLTAPQAPGRVPKNKEHINEQEKRHQHWIADNIHGQNP